MKYKPKPAEQISIYLFQAKQLAISLDNTLNCKRELAVLIYEIERAQKALNNILALQGNVSGYMDDLPKVK